MPSYPDYNKEKLKRGRAGSSRANLDWVTWVIWGVIIIGIAGAVFGFVLGKK